MQVKQVEDAAELIRMEYAEVPGLGLTFWQVQRLWNQPEDLCQCALTMLILSGFLVRTRDGRYRRPHPERTEAESSVLLLRAI